MYGFTDQAPFDRNRLEELRVRLSRMGRQELQRFYEACWHMCRLEQGCPPRAPFIQQLVQAWKEMQRRN
jgi:hypothetical protein